MGKKAGRCTRKKITFLPLTRSYFFSFPNRQRRKIQFQARTVVRTPPIDLSASTVSPTDCFFLLFLFLFSFIPAVCKCFDVDGEGMKKKKVGENEEEIGLEKSHSQFQFSPLNLIFHVYRRSPRVSSFVMKSNGYIFSREAGFTFFRSFFLFFSVEIKVTTTKRKKMIISLQFPANWKFPVPFFHSDRKAKRSQKKKKIEERRKEKNCFQTIKCPSNRNSSAFPSPAD